MSIQAIESERELDLGQSIDFQIQLNPQDIQLKEDPNEIFISKQNFTYTYYRFSSVNLFFNSLLLISFLSIYYQNNFPQEFCITQQICLDPKNNVVLIVLILYGIFAFMAPSVCFPLSRGFYAYFFTLSYIIIFSILPVCVIAFVNQNKKIKTTILSLGFFEIINAANFFVTSLVTQILKVQYSLLFNFSMFIIISALFYYIKDTLRVTNFETQDQILFAVVGLVYTVYLNLDLYQIYSKRGYRYLKTDFLLIFVLLKTDILYRFWRKLKQIYNEFQLRVQINYS